MHPVFIILSYFFGKKLIKDRFLKCRFKETKLASLGEGRLKVLVMWV